jgi:hypothetical protein
MYNQQRTSQLDLLRNCSDNEILDTTKNHNYLTVGLSWELFYLEGVWVCNRVEGSLVGLWSEYDFKGRSMGRAMTRGGFAGWLRLLSAGHI